MAERAVRLPNVVLVIGNAVLGIDFFGGVEIVEDAVEVVANAWCVGLLRYLDKSEVQFSKAWGIRATLIFFNVMYFIRSTFWLNCR